MKCSRRIRPIVSTTSIPHRPLHAKAGSRTNRKLGGQFWTPIPQLRGSLFHAGSQQRRAGEVAVSVVDRFDKGSVDRQQLAAIEVELPAQEHEPAENRFEGAEIVVSEVSDRLEVRLEAAQQPDGLDIAPASRSSRRLDRTRLR